MNSIAFWNCRGAKKREASLYLKEVIKDQGILFVGLVETKINAFDKVSFEKIMGADWDFFLLPSDGFSEGIMMLWRSDLASFSVLKEADQCIIGDLNVFNKGVWMIATIYGNKEVIKRRELWGSLHEVSNRKIPFIVGGDFNCILSQEDKRGGRKFVFSQGPKEMADFLNVNDLHYVGFIGSRFTWCNNKLGGDRILERLDRNGMLKFEDVWISYKASSFIIARVWRKEYQGSDMEILNKKCKKALKELFYWSKARIRDFSLEKEKLKEEISQIHEEEASVGWLTEEKLWMLRSKVKELNLVLSRLNTWWRQRANAKWIEEGDTNSKFFHSFANTRRNGKRISQIKNDEGVLTEDPEELHKEFYNFFQNKWKKRSCCTVNWPNPLSVLDDVDRRRLEVQISDAKILEVIKRLDKNKAPGPDGIMYSFIKNYWSIVGIDEGKDLGIKVAARCQKIYNLLYADDVLLLSDVKIKSIKKMNIILSNYCGWTGQRLNLKKSAMVISKNVERRRKKKIAKILEIKVVEELEYLGTKLALRRLKKANFQFLLDKSLKILNSWGNRYISLAGKLVLANSIFCNLPLFLISHSLIPLSVLREFEKNCRNFIWNNQEGKHGLHYLAWEDLCKPRTAGGWGLHSAISSVETLRAKFSWNLVVNPNSLLNRNLLVKYGEDWWKKDVIKGGSSAWKIISSGWNAMKNIIIWNVVKGTHINVLKDVWILDKCLLKWPTFVVTFEDANITLDSFILDGRWNLEKLLLFFGEDLVNVISNIQIHQDEEADFLDLKYKFSGKTIAALIKEDTVKMAGENLYLWIHKLNLYARVEVFIWRLCKNAIPTAEFLMRRRLSNSSLCPRGCGEVENVDHITSNCPKLIKVICILREWGFHVPLFYSFQQCMKELKVLSKKNPMMVKVYFNLLWISWNDRNKTKHGKKEDGETVLAANVISLVAMDKRHKVLSENWDAFQFTGLSKDFASSTTRVIQD
ncbi:uncharacterized protein LOC110091790 [Dendrobium catenatum]|uniref:uncharacterized protein LOC110091790 n=1 Tax=Dendrobium catenatum TaxID=906689 RepID=UPI00109EED0B|nr:uncharacterized protein LOC110091790 [Dendrobium catenatum]